MNIDSIKQLLGLTTDDGKVRALLEDLGVTSAPRLPPDDTDVNVERKYLGLYVVLTDDAFFHGKENAPIGVGPLILTNVTVYCAPTPDFEAFTGALPFGLDPSDDQEAARRKLGKPEL